MKQPSSNVKPLIVAVSLALNTAIPSYAQNVPGVALEEVLVTGERTGIRDLQEVPIAITALNTDEIDTLGIRDFGDIGYAAPNVSALPQPGDTAAPAYAIRGITSGLLSFTVDSGIGLYIDGVYIGRPAGSAFEVAGIDQIEVLKGPQSTLYGRNTTGGAIGIMTRKPSDEMGLEQRLTGGNFGLFESKTTLNSGEHDGWSAMLSYLHTEHDGYQDNITPNIMSTVPFGNGQRNVRSTDEFGKEDIDAVFLSVNWEASDALTLDYRFDYTDSTATQRATQMTTATEGLAFLLSESIGAGGTGFISQNYNRHSPSSFMSDVDYEIYGHNLTADWEFSPGLTLKSISGYRHLDNKLGGNDPDGNDIINVFSNDARLELFSGVGKRSQHQFSQEFQLIGDFDRWQWVAGLYYFDEHGKDVIENFPGAEFTDGMILPTAFPLLGAIEADNTSKAAYGQASYDLTDAITLTAGLRYTQDDRKITRIIENPSSDDKTFTHTDGNVTLSYAFSDNLNAYAKYATGYLSGGFQNGLSNSIGEPKQFDPEELDSYEIGLKGEFFDNRIRINTAAFYNDYTDMQVAQFVANQLIIVNAGKADVSGFEVELTGAITDDLTLNASYGYQDFDIKQLYLTPDFDAADFGAQRANTPEATGSVGVTYVTDLGWGEFALRTNAAWRDDIPYTVLPPSTPELKKALTAKSHWYLTARASVSEIEISDYARIEIALWGKNLTDEDVKTWGTDFGDFTNAQFMDPLTYGLDVTLSF